jgi:hypothetical protein
MPSSIAHLKSVTTLTARCRSVGSPNRFGFSLRFHMVGASQLLKTPEFRRVAPISASSLLPASALNQGSFPPPALPGFPGNTSLSATLSRPACPSRASGWSCARPRERVSRVARAFLVCMLSPLPRHSDWTSYLAHPSQSYQSSPVWPLGRPVHRRFRGLLGVHSHYGLHTRAVTVFRDTLYPKASATSLPP